MTHGIVKLYLLSTYMYSVNECHVAVKTQISGLLSNQPHNVILCTALYTCSTCAGSEEPGECVWTENTAPLQ